VAHKVAASFKKDERPLDGLFAVEKQMIDEPYSEIYVIAKVRVRRVDEDIEDGGTKTVTFKLAHIEPMINAKDEKDSKKIFERAAKARLGELPQQSLFDIAEDTEPDEDAEKTAQGADDETEGK
jgi:hypothetical protein